MIELHAVRGETGELLRELLHERGIRIGRPGDAIVSYGVNIESNRPTLNKRAGMRNKFQELQALRAGQVLVPNHTLAANIGDLQFPVLGRAYRHTRGRDIVPILANDAEWRYLHNRADFFVQYIPKQREYRVWSYRRRFGGAYEKVLERPQEYRGIIGNWHNGFSFQYAHECPQAVKDLGCKAVDVLGLDFGAVDIIQGTDNRYYVLEVNTAPGVQGPRQGITFVADKIARWVEMGYPRRNGEQPRVE